MVSTTLTNAWVVVNGGGGSVEGGVEEDWAPEEGRRATS